jgi:UV DNA damage endonuclease
MIKKTYQQHGIDHASKLALANVRDLIEIIKWNHKHGIKLFRFSSCIFPWMSEYELKDLPDYNKIKILMNGAGRLANKYGQRLTVHPGPFNQLASVNKFVVKKTIKELNQHGELMDLLLQPRTNQAKINIHIGCATGGKEAAAQRFCENFQKLDESVKTRLVVENDDKPSLFTTQELYDMVHKNIGIPITFDYHHHWCNPGEIDPLTEEQALKLASTTWPKGVRQCTHYSSAKRVYEDESAKIVAHADYVYNHINDYGLDIDVVVEAKAKELAILKYNQEFENNKLFEKAIA